MYNEQIENLINIALRDGELNEKEKQILFKKAEAAGIDLDEFEMVLDSKLFDFKKSEEPSLSSAPKSDKLGDVKRCPACAAIVQSFATKCADCGTEFRNIEASQNITKFFEKLDELEANRKDTLFESKDIDSGTTVGTLIKWWLFWWVLLPLKLITFIANKTKPGKWSVTDSRKEEMIMNFPVPNSREDIIEFITLSISKIKTIGLLKRIDDEGKYISKWNAIWKKKAEQVYTKAKISMQEDKSTIIAIEGMLIEAEIIKKK